MSLEYGCKIQRSGLARGFDAVLFGPVAGDSERETAPPPQDLHLSTSGPQWPKTSVTDARDVYDKISTEKCGLPQQKALTLEIATFREWLVNPGAQIRWTADENMIMNGLT